MVENAEKACPPLSMAHLRAYPNCPIISIEFRKCPPSTTARRRALRLESRQKGKIVIRNGLDRRRKMEKRRSILVCSGNSSAGGGVGLVGENGDYRKGKGMFGNMVSEYGWRVRRLVEEEDEMRRVAQIQAEAFHSPVAFFNDLFFQFFQAEVLAALIYKLRNSPPDRYACLVAEPVDGFDSLQTSQNELVGVVDVTVMRDEAVLRHINGAKEYLYVSGIAVLKDFRRKKVATALLKACDLLSLIWGFEYLALRAYEDDSAACKLYSNAGYRVVSGDPQLLTTWIGRKRRVLMIKQSGSRDWC